MAVEIERKFLINVAKWNKVAKDAGTFYRQGYLLIERGRTIRVRIIDEQGFLNIKGPASGITRPEFEYEIPGTDAFEILKKFCTSVITKRRFHFYHLDRLWEVDEFFEDNEGLFIAEIELSSELEVIELPEWIEQEVTGQEKYYNSSLSLHPFKKWKS